jgi:hypothetical protein
VEVITFGPEPPKPESATGGVVAVPAVVFGPTLEYTIPRSATRNLHRLISTAKWPKGGPLNDSSSVVLGVDFDTSGPRLSLISSCFGDLIRDINSMLCSVIKDPVFQWSSLFIDVNTVGSARVVPVDKGPAFSFVYGNHSGSALLEDIPLKPRVLYIQRLSRRRVGVSACGHRSTVCLRHLGPSRPGFSSA